jgi:hypothetical protein
MLRWRPLTGCLPIVAFLLGLHPAPALPAIYSCADASGRTILRDMPCKPSETSRGPGRAARTAKPAPAPGEATQTLGKLTEAQVQELADGIEAAMTRRDMNALLGYLARDAVVEVEYRLPQGLQFKRFNKEEYATHLHDGSEFASAPDYRRENTRMLLAPNARYAELTTALRQTIRVEGKPLPGVTRSKAMVELRDGHAQIILLRTVTTFDSPEQKDSAEKGQRANAR